MCRLLWQRVVVLVGLMIVVGKGVGVFVWYVGDNVLICVTVIG